MSETSTETKVDHVGSISELRQSLVPVIAQAEKIILALVAERHPAGRELSTVKTKLQEARMWAGQGLSHFNTGFKPSDIPEDESSHSKELNV